MLTKTDKKKLAARDRILFGKTAPPYGGGIAYFSGIKIEDLKRLKFAKCLDPADYFNCSPEAGEFMAFMEAHPGFTAHGYAYHPDRFEEVGGILHSINIEGIELRAPQIDWQTTQDFVLAFRHADDFVWECDNLYCWYD